MTENDSSKNSRKSSGTNAKSQRNTWICETEKILLDSPVMKLVEQNCRSSEDERRHRFFLMRSRDWCNIIPITEDGKVVMVKQYRVGIGDHTMEVPGGVTDPSDENIMAAAVREMIEETGYVPLPESRCIPLGKSLSNPAIFNNHCHSFVVGPVRREAAQSLDHGEMIEVVEIPIGEIPKLIQSGEISHALMLNTFFFLTLQTNAGSQALTTELAKFTSASIPGR